MKKFFSFIIKQSVAIVLAVIFILGFGIFATLKMSINLLPDINVPMVCVQVIYPGANAKSVEEHVTVELEDGLSSISGITNVDSYSYDNLSAVVLSFDYGTDTKEKKSDIQGKLSSLDLPDGVTCDVYDIDLNAEALAVLSVTSGEGADEKEQLKNAYSAAKELKSSIEALDGVESVEIKGGAEVSYVIKPYGGLELAAPLFVQAFSYGSLDIPLGNITQDGSDVQIHNNSDVKSVADIENMPITLPSQIVTLLTSVKQIMRYYEDSTEQDLIDLQTDLSNGVLTVLSELDTVPAEDVDDFSTLKTYMNIAATYTAQNLSDIKGSRYYSEIKDRLYNEDGSKKTDDELAEIADDVNANLTFLPFEVSADLLKIIRDDKIDTLIAYRTALESTQKYKDATADGSYYAPDEDDYLLLEKSYVKVYGKEYNYADIPMGDEVTLTAEQETELRYNIDFAQKTSATGLAAIADKKRENENPDDAKPYCPTDSECALLFMGTTLSSEHPIISSPTFMAFVRADSYEENMNLLITRRAELHTKHYNEETQEESDITAEEFFALYSELNLDGVFEFSLSQQLINFILITDFTNLINDSLVVNVSDIAEVDTQEDFSSYVYFGSGTPQVIKGAAIEVYKSNGANSSAVVDQVKKIYADFAKEKGAAFGVNADNIKLLDDQSEFISDSISNVLVSMLIGGLLAVIIIFLFLKKARTSLIIAVTMPLSVLAALICLYLMGITLNMVSLGGLAVGIGMLVDNSIVVIESISKHRDAGKSAFEAAVDGTTEVGGALFGSTLTTVCVFIPIIFSGGLTGEIFTDLSWAVIFSLTFSLIIAVSVIPALYSMFNGGKRMLKGATLAKSLNGTTENAVMESAENSENAPAATENGEYSAYCSTQSSVATEDENSYKADKNSEKKPKKKFKERLQVLKQPKIMNGISGFYGKVLPAVLNKKLITILLAVVIFGASIGLLFLTGTEFLPSIDKGQIEITMSYGSGKSLEAVETDVREFTYALQKGIDGKDGRIEGVENIDYVSLSVGKNGLLALTDTGIITVQLKTNRGTDDVVAHIRNIAQAYNETGNEIGRSFTVRQIDGVVASLMSGADDLSVTVVGEDTATLKKIAEEICTELAKPENGFTDIKNGATDSAKELDLKFNRRKMAELGLDYQTVVLTLRIGIASHTACTVTIDDEEYNLNVKFADGAVENVEDIENFVVGAQTDDGIKAVKLKDICEITLIETEACIRRSGGKEMVSVSAAKPQVDTGTAGRQLREVAEKVLKNYEGYSFEQSGISSYLNDAFSGLAVALVISFFLLYAVMAVQFGSALKPLIIMASIPFSFTGGFIALTITGTSLNVVSFIGLIMLMGVVVNNAIVMLEKIKQLESEGMESYFAVQAACRERLRPILMTTLTTILALIPLAIGVGQGSELMQPLGIVVIGGLLIGTLVTLVLVPAVYCAVKRVCKKYPNGKRAANKAATEAAETQSDGLQK